MRGHLGVGRFFDPYVLSLVVLVAAVLVGACDRTGRPSGCERFTALWEPRLDDTQFVEQLVEREGYPQNILDEGFHALGEREQRRLVDCLVEQLEDQDPLPEGTTRQQREQVRDLVFLLIFRKDQLPPVESHDLTGPAPTVGATAPVVPPVDDRESSSVPQPSSSAS